MVETPKSGSASDSPALNVSETLAASGCVCACVCTRGRAVPSHLGGSFGRGSSGSRCPLQELPPPCPQGLGSLLGAGMPAWCCYRQS